ncbi:MAG TPA: hypothetical protein VEA38_16585 [Terriglobales bacterium]|nr:hypothetical protein [Terriglobales bacterium]
MSHQDALPHIVDIMGDREFPKLGVRTDHLDCELTDEEKLAKAQELGRVTNDIAAEVDRQKAIKQQLAARLGELHARQSALAITVTRGVELRPVEVVTLANYEGGVAHEVRTDSSRVIKTRPLEDHERQQQLIEDVPVVEAAPEPAGVSA